MNPQDSSIFSALRALPARRGKRFILLIILAAGLFLPLAYSFLKSPAPLFSDCDPAKVLPQVDKLLAGSIFEAHYVTLNKDFVLSIWLIEPALNPVASDDEIAENSRQAFKRGAMIAHQVVSQIPCVRELFHGINPMIVDRNYNSWYIDVIPMRAFPLAKTFSPEELMAVIERSGMELAEIRQTAPPADVTPPNACPWPEVRAVIQEIIGSERRNQAAYLIIDNEQVLVQIQWDTALTGRMSDSEIGQRVALLSEPLSCLAPPLDTLEFFVVDAKGRLQIYGQLSGEVIRDWQTISSPEEQIEMHHIPRWWPLN